MGDDTRERPTLNARAILQGTLQCPPGITWTKDIKALFAADADYISHMISVTNGKLDLGDYTSVKMWASTILVKLKSGDMPPFPYPAFTPEQVNLFACWIQQGMPE